MNKLPTTPRLAKLLLLAESISREMGWTYVGTEHVLLALFKIDGLGNTMLKASGASEEAAEKALRDWAEQPNLAEDSWLEEQVIDAGFEKWWGTGKNRDGKFDRHISLCAFHAGARFQQGEPE